MGSRSGERGISTAISLRSGVDRTEMTNDRTQSIPGIGLPKSLCMRPLIVMLGVGETYLPTVRGVAWEFGIRAEPVQDLNHALRLSQTSDIAAVFFHRQAFGPQCSWTNALHLLACGLPGTHLIPCHGFSESVDRDQLSDTGAFHFLWLPLKHSELRQCLGFIWQTLRQAALDPTAAER